MPIHIVNYCIRGRLHKLEKLVSDPYLLYLANTNMFKLKKCYCILELARVDYHENET